MRSQTSTEYLIISAVVIIIAVLVIGVLGGVPFIGGSSGTKISQAELSTQRIGVVSYASDESGTQLVLRNNLAQKVLIDSLSLGTQSITVNRSISPGKEITVHHLGAFTQQRYTYDLLVNYTIVQTSAEYSFDIEDGISGQTAQGSSLFEQTVGTVDNALFDDLFIWMRFEQDASDSSGNGLNGSLVGNLTIVNDGVYGNALRSVGNTQMQLGSGDLGFIANSTYSFWIKQDPIVTSYKHYFEEQASSCCQSPRAFVQMQSSGRIYYYFTWANSDSTCTGFDSLTTASYNDSQWHHIVMRRASTNLSLFIDGTLIEDNVDVGCNIHYTSSSLDLISGPGGEHVMDDFMLFQRPLSNAEIQELYRLGS